MDALVIGCGLTGSVIARYIAEHLGKKVVVWDRRNHIGGNMYDYYDEHGILLQKYGPHIFHTSNVALYQYICKFGKWKNYNLSCGAIINQKYTPTPFNFRTIDEFYSKEEAIELKDRIKKVFSGRDQATIVEVLNCTDEKVRAYAQFLFDNDYSLYTAKQWGIPASEIDPSVLKRVPLRFSYDEGFFEKNEIQVIPEKTYTSFFEKILDHPNIKLELGIDALEHIKVINGKLLLDKRETSIPIIYTGALDELFNLSEGRLPYRSLRFEWKHENIDGKQDAAVVAYPQAPYYTRITEYKKLLDQNVTGTTYAVEYPLPYDETKVMEPYYPVLTEFSNEMYAKYLMKAKNVEHLYIAGRLADFKYYNMDQTLERALELCKTIKL